MAEVDLQLKKAFQEHQNKIVETGQKLQKGEMMCEWLRTQNRKAALTKEQLKQMDTDTNTYLSVGRMFVKRSMAESISNLENSIKETDEKITAIEKSKQVLEKNLQEAQNNLREMVQERQLNR